MPKPDEVKKEGEEVKEENKEEAKKDEVVETEDEKSQWYLLESKLFSGGIENRFMKIFSKESRLHIKELCEITGDDTVKSYLELDDITDDD